MIRRFRSLYGASPLHLLAVSASLAITAAALVRWFDPGEDAANIAIWFGGAIVAHDLALFPLYTLLDHVAGGGHGGSHPRYAIAYLRVPAMLSLLLLLMFLPVIAGFGRATFHDATGHYQHGYLARWLIATGVLFLISALAYARRLARADRGLTG